MADNRELNSVIQIDGVDYNVHAKTAEKVLKSLKIEQANGTAVTFDGSAECTITIPDVPTNVSDLADADAYAKKSELFSKDYYDLTNTPTIPIDTNTTYDLNAPASKPNGDVTINLTAGGSGSGTDSVKITGTGATTVTTDADGVITISSTGGGTGNGDMLKSVYDKNSNGKVDVADNADNAEKLGGVEASAYALRSALFSKNYNDLTNKPAIPTITDSLTSTSTIAALSANQGRVLDERITAINTNIGNLGGGDMLKSVYAIGNANNTNKVDKAINAEQLGGTAASNYAKKSDIPSITVSTEEPTGGATGDIWFKY